MVALRVERLVVHRAQRRRVRRQRPLVPRAGLQAALHPARRVAPRQAGLRVVQLPTPRVEAQVARRLVPLVVLPVAAQAVVPVVVLPAAAPRVVAVVRLARPVAQLPAAHLGRLVAQLRAARLGGGGSVTISGAQRTQAVQALSSVNITPVQENITVSVGQTLPTTVTQLVSARRRL